jgi:hypothetical protein
VGYFDRKDIVQQRRTSVNPDKTGLVAFTRKRKFPGFFKPQFLGVKLSILGSFKYLGGYPGLSVELERGCGGQVEEGS